MNSSLLINAFLPSTQTVQHNINMQSRSSTSEDCPVLSSDFSLPNLSFENPAPFNPFDDDSHNIKHHQLDTTPTKTNTTIHTNKLDMLHFRHSSLEFYTEPDPTTVSSSSGLSESSSLSSFIPSTSSTTPQDWIAQSLSNVDILAPTVPDLSFSFVPSSNHTSTPHKFNPSIIERDDNEQESNLLKPLENKRSSQYARLINGDSSPIPSSSNLQIKSPSINSIQSSGSHNITKSPLVGNSPRIDRVKSHHRFLLSGHTGSKGRNSPCLESQLDFLTQQSSPMLHMNNDELIMVAQTGEELRSLERAQEPINLCLKDADTFNPVSRKEGQKRMSAFLKLGNKPDGHQQNILRDDDYRKRRLSASNLLDRANFLFFNSTRQTSLHRSDSNEHVDKLPKAWLDPTLANNETTSSTSHIKSSRSLFTLLSSKFR